MKNTRFLPIILLFVAFYACNNPKSTNPETKTETLTDEKTKTLERKEEAPVKSATIEPSGNSEVPTPAPVEEMVIDYEEAPTSISDGAYLYKRESDVGDFSAPLTTGSRRAEKSSAPRSSSVASTTTTVYSAMAGKLTAGEINDFQKWSLWNDLKENELKAYRERWKLTPHKRYSVSVQTQKGNPMADCAVELLAKNGTVIWRSRTDNTGKAELWAEMFEFQKTSEVHKIRVLHLNNEYKIEKPKTFENGINFLKVNTPCNLPEEADILFTVDATGSMGDEIQYLQAELLDIIKKAKQQHSNVKINLGSVFYRDHGDEYVTSVSPFSKDVNVTNKFIAAQGADGGGDGPEAVDDALHVSVNEMAWSKSARARLMFLILDAPPHAQKNNTDRIKAAVAKAAEKGIRVIPLVASGGGYEQDKSMEYLMRSIALATNGTYAFLTDHSGVGGKHTAPSTDKYEVETLNKLLLRLISQFVDMPACDPLQFIEDQKPEKDTSFVQLTLPNPPSNPELPSVAILKAYPNPAKDVIWADASGEITELFLTDNSGKILQRYLPAVSRQQIELFNYTSGIYFIKAKVEEQWLTTRVIVSR